MVESKIDYKALQLKREARFRKERTELIDKLLDNIVRDSFKIKNYVEAAVYFHTKVNELELISGEEFSLHDNIQFMAMNSVYFGVFPIYDMHGDQNNWINNTPLSYEQGWADMINLYRQKNGAPKSDIKKNEFSHFVFKEIPEYRKYLMNLFLKAQGEINNIDLERLNNIETGIINDIKKLEIIS
jgi:hypothetical protein